MKILALVVVLGSLGTAVEATMCMSGGHPTVHAHNKDNKLHGDQKLCKKCAKPKIACSCGK